MMGYPSLHMAMWEKERVLGQEVKYVVRLTDEERQRLQHLVAGPGWPDTQSAAAFDVGVSTVHRLRQPCVEAGLEAALSRQAPSRTQPRTRAGAQDAQRVALACSQAPDGRASWPLRLLADTWVARHLVEAIGRETVRPTLKKIR